MTRQETAKLVAALLAACPAQSSRIDAQRASAMIDTYTALLGDLSYEQCDAAARVLLQTRTWMPSVADIRATVAELQRGPVKAGAEAWGSVLKAIGRYGSYRKPGVDFQFDDQITARCVAALGWEGLCLSENSISDRARFVEAYDQLAAQDRKEQTSPLLAAARDARAALGETSGPVSVSSLVSKALKAGEP